MVEVSFYHLQAQPLEMALPKLLEKVFERGLRALIRTREPELAEFLNSVLWTYKPDSFLPHGLAGDKWAADHPILITTETETAVNEPSVLVLLQDADADDLENYDRCLYMFDGNDQSSLSLARARWKAFKGQGVDVTYWQQTETGWQKKA
ncbi:MAG: DNA polymerase III subunit chi [Sneathiella sp.]|nr:DNA polymerase III subunit chi [Sneathiella sp.]